MAINSTFDVPVNDKWPGIDDYKTYNSLMLNLVSAETR